MNSVDNISPYDLNNFFSSMTKFVLFSHPKKFPDKRARKFLSSFDITEAIVLDVFRASDHPLFTAFVFPGWRN